MCMEKAMPKLSRAGKKPVCRKPGSSIPRSTVSSHDFNS